ncbi:MAG: site-specific integrase, partial [Verrucomicrobiota bacterium]
GPRDYESPALTAELQAPVGLGWIFALLSTPGFHTLRGTKQNTLKHMKTTRKPTRLKRSKLENLFRHANGVYYARIKVNHKSKERSLHTTDYNLAASLLPETLRDLRGASEEHQAGTLAHSIQAEADRDDPDLKPTTQHYYRQLATSILKSLPPHVAAKKLPQVTVGDLRAWRDIYAAQASKTRHNGALALLRRVWNRAIERREAASNPADALKRLKPDERHWYPPNKEKFAELVESILSQGKSHSKAAAMAVELLAYTGMRISEAQAVTWGDIRDGHIVRRIAKNDGIGKIPLIPAALDLLERMKTSGVPSEPADPVMLMKSPRIALEGACERLGIDHLRVHDLRHIFATRCLESGVDFPTLAGWLGHKDGGILAAKVYGHLVPDHSSTQARKVLA